MNAEVEKVVASLPLDLVVDQDGVGGVAGISPAPTVAVRDASTTDSYLDWGDNTFKTAGWTLKNAPLTDVGGGHYRRALNVSTLPLAVGARFVAEFRVSTSTMKGEDADSYLITDEKAQVELVRKYHTNRMHEASGNPGSIVLYDDDDATALRTHQLRDETGGAVGPSTATPARRSKGT